MGMKVDAATFAKLTGAKRPKYGNRKTAVGGYLFDSKREATRYLELKAMEAGGWIAGLQLQVRFVFEVNGVRVGHFTADFVYHDCHGLVVEDVKSVATRRIRDYPLRKRLMLACHGVKIKET